METVALIIEDQVIRVNKDLLAEHSDYFRAMFSGNYIEIEQNEIRIDVVDANSMNILINYMESGYIDLLQYPLNIVGKLANSANFLQITELVQQLINTLDIHLNLSNCIEIMCIAENCSFEKLRQLSESTALVSFKDMKPEYIPSIQRLYWYLSHPYLNVQDELTVFKFGLEWISLAACDVDALSLILCCLDINKLTTDVLKEMKTLVADYTYSLGAKVIECLYAIRNVGCELSARFIADHKTEICEMFTERVCNEVYEILQTYKTRIKNLTPTLALWMATTDKTVPTPYSMYKYSEEKGFEKWLDVAEKNLWGWNIVSWGPTKVVVVCGEVGKGTGIFMRDVKVYDILRNEWTVHGVTLPSRRHGGVAVIGDLLYLVGGVGAFRVVLDMVVLYDLNAGSFMKLKVLPDAIQCPAVCVHNNTLYVATQKIIYKYNAELDTWDHVVDAGIRVTCLTSYNEYIYCMQNFFKLFYRFRPGIDGSLVRITSFRNPAASACNLGDRLLVFTKTDYGYDDEVAVEEFLEEHPNKEPKIIWRQTKTNVVLSEVTNSCTLILSIPQISMDIPMYHRHHLRRYEQ